METPCGYCYLSADTSPRSSCSLDESLSFYSAQTSPTSTEPTTPTRKFDHNFDPDEEVEKTTIPQRVMAFADDLFCNGKVVPLVSPALNKLKPPPGLPGSRSSTVAEPRPTNHKCLWNDDFDPFMVALNACCRRARSLSPHRAGHNGLSGDLIEDPRAVKTNSNFVESYHLGKPDWSVSARWAGEKHVILAEPKGVVFARRVRRVKMGQESPDEHTMSRPRRKRRESNARENKREKIMKLLFRISSSGKGSGNNEDDNKQKHQKRDSWKPNFLRRLQYRLIGQTTYNRDKRLVTVCPNSPR